MGHIYRLWQKKSVSEREQLLWFDDGQWKWMCLNLKCKMLPYIRCCQKTKLYRKFPFKRQPINTLYSWYISSDVFIGFWFKGNRSCCQIDQKMSIILCVSSWGDSFGVFPGVTFFRLVRWKLLIADVYFRFFLWLSKYFTGNNKTVLNCATVVLISLKIWRQWLVVNWSCHLRLVL